MSTPEKKIAKIKDAVIKEESSLRLDGKVKLQAAREGLRRRTSSCNTVGVQALFPHPAYSLDGQQVSIVLHRDRKRTTGGDVQWTPAHCT